MLSFVSLKCWLDCLLQKWSLEINCPTHLQPHAPFTWHPLQPAPPLLHPRYPPLRAAQLLALLAVPLTPTLVCTHTENTVMAGMWLRDNYLFFYLILFQYIWLLFLPIFGISLRDYFRWLIIYCFWVCSSAYFIVTHNTALNSQANTCKWMHYSLWLTGDLSRVYCTMSLTQCQHRLTPTSPQTSRITGRDGWMIVPFWLTSQLLCTLWLYFNTNFGEEKSDKVNLFRTDVQLNFVKNIDLSLLNTKRLKTPVPSL